VGASIIAGLIVPWLDGTVARRDQERPAEDRSARAPRLRAFRSVAGNRTLLRVVAGYALFVITEYSVWMAMLVFAYSRGGATVAGLVALAQLVPAAVLAPVTASVADRRSPVVLLAGGYLVQAAGMAATAAAVIAGAPIAAYAAAMVASAAVTTTRPAQAALLPSVGATPDQLTAVNVLAGWLEATGITTAGLLTGALIVIGGVASVCRCWYTWAAAGSRYSGWQPCCPWPRSRAAACCSAWTPRPLCRSGLSCGGAAAARVWERSPCCMPSRAPRP
jgi:hypothetical protein